MKFNFLVITEFLVLSTLWGCSFLFMRVGASEFGPIALIELRVLLAGVALIPFMLKPSYRPLFLQHWREITLVGITNSALPFCLLSYATLHLSSGFTAILNAAVPFFAAIVGYYFWQERLTWPRILGLIVGFTGVAILVWGRGHLTFSDDGLAILACLLASASYGFAANYTRHRIGHLPPIIVTSGSLWAAAIVLAPLAFVYWPSVQPSARAWSAVVLLALASTALAFIIFYHLIATIGAGRTVMVTFLIPIFASIWGVSLLNETVTSGMLIGGAVVLIGVALATGTVGKSTNRSATLNVQRAGQ